MEPIGVSKSFKNELDIAIACKELGDYEAAIQHIDRLLEEHEDDAKLHYLAGHCYWSLKLKKQAVYHFYHAVIFDKYSETMSMSLFHCQWELGSQMAALEEVKRFIELTGSTIYDNILEELTADEDDDRKQ